MITSRIFEDYVESVKEKSEELIKNQFPSRIKALADLLESPEFSWDLQKKNLTEDVNIPVPDAVVAHEGGEGDAAENGSPAEKKRKLDNAAAAAVELLAAGGIQVRAFPSGPVYCNPIIGNMFELAKPHIREVVECSNDLKMWVAFLIPKIEDGNNFGVSIQESVLEEIRILEAESSKFVVQKKKYHRSRAEVISKIAKYPHIMDFREEALELDEVEFQIIRMLVSDIRNHYSTLFDLISKNWEKLIKPRTSNSASMY